MPGFLRDPRTRGVAEASERLERSAAAERDRRGEKIAKRLGYARAGMFWKFEAFDVAPKEAPLVHGVSRSDARRSSTELSNTGQRVENAQNRGPNDGRLVCSDALGGATARRADHARRPSLDAKRITVKEKREKRESLRGRRRRGGCALIFFLGERRRGACRPLGEHMGRSLSRGPRGGGPDDEKKKKAARASRKRRRRRRRRLRRIRFFRIRSPISSRRSRRIPPHRRDATPQCRSRRRCRRRMNVRAEDRREDRPRLICWTSSRARRPSRSI